MMMMMMMMMVVVVVMITTAVFITTCPYREDRLEGYSDPWGVTQG